MSATNGDGHVANDGVVGGSRVRADAVAAARGVKPEVVRSLSQEEITILTTHAEHVQRLQGELLLAKAVLRDMERLIRHCDPTLAVDYTRSCVVRNAVPVPTDG